MPPAYAVITPVRNEQEHLHRTIDSLVNQTIQPTHWILVDDGSTDQTYDIACKAAQELSFLKVITRADRGHDKVGGGVIEAFNEGLAEFELESVQYLAKVDADISLAPDYFEQVLSRMEEDKSLGLVSGQSYIENPDGSLQLEPFKSYHPVGSARVWRATDYKAIGGLLEEEGWDTADIVKLRMRGQETVVFEDLQAIHLRAMGSRGGALKSGIIRLGRISYKLGYSRIYFVLRIGVYMLRRPFLKRGLWLLKGYLDCLRTGTPRILSKEEVRWLRRFQIRRLFGNN